jgi:primosomal protein N' (replication factor Y)
MIEFHMEYFDVLFPINLGPLTYRCHESIAEIARPGMIVSAPLKNKTAKGIIIRKSLTAPPVDVKDVDNIYVLKDIQKIESDAQVLSSKMLNLLRWMSEYYIAEQGIVLKNMLPKEVFTEVKQRKKKIPTNPPVPPFAKGGLRGILEGRRDDYPLSFIAANNGMVSGLIDSIHKKIYRTFLLHAPSSAYEYLFLTKILSVTDNAILLIPEVSIINNIYPLLSERFGERVCIFHSDLSRGKRSEAIKRILSGHSDIVVGTRSAVFAPLKKVSFIVVLHEHSSSYKQESGLYYSGRDVAVKRGYFERATVLLSSICPSIGSLYNCRTGKYTLLRPADDIKKPKIRVIDMRHEKLLKPYLSKAVVDASVRYIRNDKKVIFVVNRRGYSTLLQCMDCNYIERCPDCRIPLVFHKQDMSMRCHYCGYIVSDVPDKCGKCGGYNIKLFGAGTQRIQEDIEELIGIKTIRFDSDSSRKRSEMEGLIGATFRDGGRIIIGTKLMTKRLGITGGFSMAAIVNTDLFLNLPDFRSAEKTFQEILSVIDKIEPHGEIFIQTRMPQNYLFSHLKNYDYPSFFKEELHMRKELLYPPYSRLLLIKIVTERNLSGELLETIKRIDTDVEVLGPTLKRNSRGKNEFRLLMRSSVQGRLHSAAKTFIERFKSSKGITIKVDVDPISI